MLRVLRYAPIALLAGGVLVGSSACASGYYPYGRQNNSYRIDVQRIAFDNGYREGLDHGEKDARKGHPFSMERDGDYKDADEGYKHEYGNKSDYRRFFRDGFARGYSEAFDRYGRGNRGYSYDPRGTGTYHGDSRVPVSGDYHGTVSGNYQSMASRRGFDDGYKAGRSDARDRESYDPVRSHDYRDADHDYDNRYGSKDQYKAEYRTAFERGYAQGYREVRP